MIGWLALATATGSFAASSVHAAAASGKNAHTRRNHRQDPFTLTDTTTLDAICLDGSFRCYDLREQFKAMVPSFDYSCSTAADCTVVGGPYFPSCDCTPTLSVGCGYAVRKGALDDVRALEREFH